MQVLGKRLPNAETFSKALVNLALPERAKKPLIVAYYLTFRCNARCGFCSQKQFVYGEQRDKYRTDLKTQLRVLEAIRADTPNVYLMGGEPTVDRNLALLLAKCESLGFDTIAVNTNGIVFRQEILENANVLVISLHSMDPSKIASVYGLPEAVGDRVLENIQRYAESGTGVAVTINSVITGDNIEDIYDVAAFCRGIGAKFNVSPAISPGGRPDTTIMNNDRYRKLIDWCIERPSLLAPTLACLEVVRDLKPFVCMPNTIPGVYPNGDVVAPCPEFSEGLVPVNILQAGGLNKAIVAGRRSFEAEHGAFDTRNCAGLCHKTCYIEAANISTLTGVVRLATGMPLRLRRTNAKTENLSADEV